MKIKFIKNTGGIGYGYMEGTELDCTEAFGEEMIEIGMAVKVHRDPTSLPAELPARQILIDNGIETIEELKQITDPEVLMELKGIGKKVAQQIIDFVNK